MNHLSLYACSMVPSNPTCFSLEHDFHLQSGETRENWNKSETKAEIRGILWSFWLLPLIDKLVALLGTRPALKSAWNGSPKTNKFPAFQVLYRPQNELLSIAANCVLLLQPEMQATIGNIFSLSAQYMSLTTHLSSSIYTRCSSAS